MSLAHLRTNLAAFALALEQASAYIAKRGPSLAEYLKEWRTNRGPMIDSADAKIAHYDRTIATTWQTSVKQLTPAGRRLLERLAWLAPEPIPEFLLDAAGARRGG